MRRALVLLPLLAACAAPLPQDVTVRHVSSTETAGNGARWHLFLFDPREPRPLETRIALARRMVAEEGRCRWIDRPRSEIERQTAEQGAAYAETLLAAPLACEG
jgi:hypothetical protein